MRLRYNRTFVHFGKGLLWKIKHSKPMPMIDLAEIAKQLSKKKKCSKCFFHEECKRK